MATDWALVVSLLAFVGTALGAVWAVAQNNGSMRERLRALEAAKAKMEGELEVMQTQLARGDTRFAVLNENMEGVKKSLAKIEMLLTGTSPKRGRPLHDDGDDP